MRNRTRPTLVIALMWTSIGLGEEPMGTFSEAKKDSNGFLVHNVESPFQSEKTLLRVLVPEKLDRIKTYRVVYVLPVEAKDGSRFGNGLMEVKKNNLHNRHGVIFVAPTFASTPWYADHPTTKTLKQESHLLKVIIPFVEKTYPVQCRRDGRLLLGFSKSGVGAYALFLRHLDYFGRALAFDAPLMRERMVKGREVFATAENFEKYSIPRLLKKHSKDLQKEKRLILLGQGFLQRHHVQAHARMQELKIAHRYQEGERRRHHWGSGWVPQALQLLLPDSADVRQ